MKARFLLLTVFVALIALYVAACGTLPPSPTITQQQVLAQQLADTAAGLKQAGTDFKESAKTIAAATQASPDMHIPSNVPTAIDHVGDATGKIAVVVQGASNAATQPSTTPITFVVDTAKTAADTGLVPQPYASYIQLAALLFGTGGVGAGLLGMFKAKTSAKATASQTAAIQTLVDTKQITVNPGSGNIANNIVADHPSTAALIDTLTSAAKDPRIA